MAAIDNDDTSAHYEAHHNVFAFSEMGLKVDFAGHDNCEFLEATRRAKKQGNPKPKP